MQISHAQLLQTVALHGNNEDTFSLCFSSYSGVTSTFFTISAVINHEKRLITKSQFDVDICFDLLEKFRVTNFITKPNNFKLVMESPRYQTAEVDCLKTLILTGFDVSVMLREEIQKRFPLIQIIVCGLMTEIGGIIYVSDSNHSDSSLELSENTQLKILLENGLFGDFEEPGEVLIKRPENFLGYFENDSATMEIIDKEGWFYTGDIGYFDETLKVTLIGRKSLIIRCQDKILNPLEIEENLKKIPGVEEAFVVGVPSAKFHEFPSALIVKDLESIVTTEMILESIKNVKTFDQLVGGINFVDKNILNDTKQHRREIMKSIAINLFAKEKIENKKLEN